MSLLLDAKNLSYGTPSGKILQRDLQFQLQSGECLLIEGENGTGKSTLLKVILGQMKPLGGKVNCPLRSSEIGYLPQLENAEVHTPMTLRDVLGLVPTWFPYKKALEEFPILTPSQLNLRWNQASGGERKRTLLLRALIQLPKLLVLDEPFNHLDENTQKQMQQILTKYLNQGAILLVSHDPITLPKTQRLTLCLN